MSVPSENEQISLLLKESEEGSIEAGSSQQSYLASSNSFLRRVVVLQTLLIVTLIILLLRSSMAPSIRCSSSSACGQVLYSPAQSYVSYEAKQFNFVVNVSDSVYSSPPSEEVDRAWAGLYNGIGLSQISSEEAYGIPDLDKNVVLPGETPQYVVTLSVFHQLHCLNTLRKYMYAEYYADPVTGEIAETDPAEADFHIGHCFDFLRQATMCSADISPIVWSWNSEIDKAEPTMSVTHSCRNWDRILEWAQEHKLKQNPKKLVHIR